MVQEESKSNYECIVTENTIVVGKKINAILPIEKIILLKSGDGYIDIVTESSTKPTIDSLSSFEERLCNLFYRVHHRVIVNIRHIKDIKHRNVKCTLFLSNGEEIAVARRRIAGFIEHLKNNLR
jgi:DNA-binding LytR/AlgR family response regulator